MLHDYERIAQLYAEDIQIIQSAEVFSFSLDAVLLANFARVPKKAKSLPSALGMELWGCF